jgi:hypothetical protein
MVQDLSFTFHVVSYQSGNIANWPLVIDTTLAIKPPRYPMGWKPRRLYAIQQSQQLGRLDHSVSWLASHAIGPKGRGARGECGHAGLVLDGISRWRRVQEQREQRSGRLLFWCTFSRPCRFLGSVEAALVAPRSSLPPGRQPIRSLSPATAWLRAPQRRLGRGRNRSLLACHCSVHDFVYRLAGLNGVGTF